MQENMKIQNIIKLTNNKRNKTKLESICLKLFTEKLC